MLDKIAKEADNLPEAALENQSSPDSSVLEWRFPSIEPVRAPGEVGCPSEDDLNRLAEVSRLLEGASAEEILAWAVKIFFPQLTMATAFGPEGCVILSILAKIESRVRVFNLDTGYQFQETLDLRDRIARELGIEVELAKPETSVEEYERLHGGRRTGACLSACGLCLGHRPGKPTGLAGRGGRGSPSRTLATRLAFAGLPVVRANERGVRHVPGADGTSGGAFACG